jgi:hypothetical protein
VRNPERFIFHPQAQALLLSPCLRDAQEDQWHSLGFQDQQFLDIDQVDLKKFNSVTKNANEIRYQNGPDMPGGPGSPFSPLGPKNAIPTSPF